MARRGGEFPIGVGARVLFFRAAELPEARRVARPKPLALGDVCGSWMHATPASVTATSDRSRQWNENGRSMPAPGRRNHSAVMWIGLGLASAVLGSVMVSTPSLYAAFTAPASTACGNETWRW